MFKSLALAAGILALSAGAASANITVVQGGVPGNPPQNVLLNNGQSGLSITGLTNNTSTSITFTSNETITAPANGQARVTAADGAFTFLNIAPTLAGLGFSAMEFNLNATSTGSALIQFFDQFGGTFGGTYTLGSAGQNFFNATATNGEVITRATITSQVPISDVAQVRVGNVIAFNAVPESATWTMMILGLGMVGMGLRLRRRTPAAVAV